MMGPRLFLVAPPGLGANAIASCATAAVEAGDAASIVLPRPAMALAPELQGLGFAVLCDGPHDESGDGIHVDAETCDFAAARKRLGTGKIIGAFCGASRHLAMQAGEAGADYIAFDQTAYAAGEPIIRWWSDLFEIPCVAFAPVNAAALDILLPQKPDFIRPSDSMWENAENARDVVSELMRRMRR
jgi:thiamine-phosphate pyrophosphorylase